jgi:hypothetical protein
MMTDSRPWLHFLSSFVLGILSLYSLPISSFAQVTTSITPSGLNTQVSAPSALPSGQVNYNITGGTRPGNGTNLFHSFGNFSVGSNNIANFLNDSGLPTSNTSVVSQAETFRTFSVRSKPPASAMRTST